MKCLKCGQETGGARGLCDECQPGSELTRQDAEIDTLSVEVDKFRKQLDRLSLPALDGISATNAQELQNTLDDVQKTQTELSKRLRVIETENSALRDMMDIIINKINDLEEKIDANDG